MSNSQPDASKVTPEPTSEATKDDHNHTKKSFFSFGDEGTTATVGASGRLLRISRYLPGHKTGFCVDDLDMPRAWLVRWRFETLLDWAEPLSKRGGIGPSIDGTSEEKIINDRWPTFEGTWDNGSNFKLQYIAFKGTIYQRFEFSNSPIHDENGQIIYPSAPELQLTPDLLIRNLDFVHGNDTFNTAKPGDNPYKSSKGNGGHCLVREHFNGAQKALLSIHAFDDEDLLQFVQIGEPEGNGEPYAIRAKDATQESAANDGSPSTPFTITLAYTLDYVDKDELAFPSLPNWKAIPPTMAEQLRPYPRHSLTNGLDPTLDLFLARNLEYILSVCSIPVSNPSDDDAPLFALTCGDVESHRVTIPASFHAFQFLILALDHLQLCKAGWKGRGLSEEDHLVERAISMQARIFRICSGHIKWLVQAVKASGNLSCPNYWINGDEIPNWEGNSFLPQKSLAIAPFQIIKACEFWNLAEVSDFWGLDTPHKTEMPSLLDDLTEPLEAWLEELDRINKLGLYAFPRYDSEPTDSFYLTDHALIWRALRSTERIYPKGKLKGPKSNISYSSQVLRQHMIKRFTTENPQAKKRMIAVTRSPLQTRFLLRSRDTALFPAVDLGFFDTPESERHGTERQLRDKLWTQTIDCQKDHEDNEDLLNWNDPLRFALSVIMSTRKKQMNSRSEDEMQDYAMSVLFNGTSASCLFPGWLGQEHTHVPYDSEASRDRYWEVTFEIPYILWKYCYESIWSKTTPSRSSAVAVHKSEIQLILDEVKLISKTSTHVHKLLRDGQSSASRTPKTPAPLDHSMKRLQPFNNIVDEKNIVELQDEWLYNRPSFFVQGPSPISNKSDDEESRSSISIATGDGTSNVNDEASFVGFMADVPKSKVLHRGKKDIYSDDQSLEGVQTLHGVRSLMETGRTIERSKKRLWVLQSATPLGNRACLHTVLKAERNSDQMQGFFKRHRSYVSRFTEETVAVLNMWTTEIHMSFYRLGSTVEGSSNFVAHHCEEFPSLPAAGGSRGKTPLTKVSMSFHFEGDFFDRYWTCRFLETDQQANSLSDLLGNANNTEAMQDRRARSRKLRRHTNLCWKEIMRPLDNGHGSNLRKDSWQQRRVLELLLFGKMLQRMNSSAKQILNESWLSLRNKTKDLPEGSQRGFDISEEAGHDVFLITTAGITISRKRAEQIQRVLRTSIANVEENMAQIALWQSREKDRQAERPRWTFHDENRFRVIIQKLSVANDHEILELSRLHIKISKLEESLVKKLEMIRSDLEERRGGETQLFTWVTVVFLPLGFATGIFSMSEAPSTQTLHSMIVTAVVAFISIALLGPLVKTIISADVVRLPQVTKWTSQDWRNWAQWTSQDWSNRTRRWQMKIKHERKLIEDVWGMNKKTWKTATGTLGTTLMGQWTMDAETWRIASEGCRQKINGWLEKMTWTNWKTRVRGKKRWEDTGLDSRDTELGMGQTTGSTRDGQGTSRNIKATPEAGTKE